MADLPRPINTLAEKKEEERKKREEKKKRKRGKKKEGKEGKAGEVLGKGKKDKGKNCNGPWPGLYYSRPLAGTYPIGLMI